MTNLGTEHYLHNFYADGIVYETQLTDKAIEEMENQFKGNIHSILDTLAKLKAVVPFM